MAGDITDSGFFGTEGGDAAEALDPAVINLINELLAQAGPGREGLIRVLLGLQQVFDRVSWRVQELVADRFGLSPAQVAGVVSYYPKLSAERRGRHKVDVCIGSGCFLRGGERILRQFDREVAEQTSKVEEPRLAVRQERCFGVCGLGPVIRIDDRVRAMVDQKEADAIVESLLDPESQGEDDR